MSDLDAMRAPEAGDRSAPRRVEVNEAILRRNQSSADENRQIFRERGWLAVNVLSSPGSGKTELLCRTSERLLQRGIHPAVVVGDLATDNDARRLQAAGAPVVQIVTGTLCHLDADMVRRAVESLPAAPVDVLLIENVGNLVCPSAYDLGEAGRAVLLSVTEGEDKPRKYPTMFKSATLVVITKVDLASPAGFDRDAAYSAIRGVAPQAAVLETSARTGAGIDAWIDALLALRQ
ncbi:MAG TPA: hydrogenase nickel incorporation protein HypB [Chthonomonadales bacterium]|nr:hydrogenase nickel incorporation protein HypB [Chthonomonadales bacterium]